MSYKMTVVNDILLNFIATVLPICVLQLYIFPGISEYITTEKYGLFISIYAFLNLVPATLGNTLNNVRLIKEGTYKKLGTIGDFQILLIILQSFNVLVSATVLLLYFNIDNVYEITILLGSCILWTFREYYFVAFRMQLNYRLVLENSIVLSLFSCLAYYFVKKINLVYIFFFLPQLFSLIHVCLTTELHKERFIRTVLFYNTSKDEIFLILSAVLSRLIGFADKIMLYPILGGTAVTIYYIATLLGKTMGIAITPMNSVILSYLARYEERQNDLLKKICIISLIMCVLCYFIIVKVSVHVLEYLYPTYVKDVLPYVSISTISMLTLVYSTIISPFVLKFCKIKWQIYINGTCALVYLILGYYLAQMFGIYGFNVSIILSNSIRILISLIVYKYT